MAVTIANPLVITFNAVSKSLNRINQDSYGSEYYLREALADYRVKIRHSVESPQKSGITNDRHNVELTYTLFATATSPAIITQVYSVLRDDNQHGDSLTLQYAQAALNGLMTADNVDALFGWVN